MYLYLRFVVLLRWINCNADRKFHVTMNNGSVMCCSRGEEHQPAETGVHPVHVSGYPLNRHLYQNVSWHSSTHAGKSYVTSGRHGVDVRTLNGLSVQVVYIENPSLVVHGTCGEYGRQVRCFVGGTQRKIARCGGNKGLVREKGLWPQCWTHYQARARGPSH